MPYLDEDILYNNVEEKYKSAKGEARKAYSDVLDTICEMTRADVVPKSEVEMLKICYEGSQKTIKGLTEMIREKTKELAKLETHLELHYGEKSLNNLIAEEKADVAMEIFEEIEKILIDSAYIPDCARFVDIDKLAELKKKYTENENG